MNYPRISFPSGLLAIMPTLFQPVLLLIIALKTTINFDQFFFAPELLPTLSILAVAWAVTKIIIASVNLNRYLLGSDSSASNSEIDTMRRKLITKESRLLTGLLTVFVITMSAKYSGITDFAGDTMLEVFMITQNIAYIASLGVMAGLIYTWSTFRQELRTRSMSRTMFMPNFINTLIRYNFLQPDFRVLKNVTNPQNEVEVTVEIGGKVFNFSVTLDGMDILSSNSNGKLFQKDQSQKDQLQITKIKEVKKSPIT